jgi:hypothetical protein
MIERTCAGCGDADVDDMRHVNVECFYQVNEVAPQAAPRTVFREVPDGVHPLGRTRRYWAGGADALRTWRCDNPGPGEDPVRVETVEEPLPPIRLVEVTTWGVRCYKPCSGRFLDLFGEWAKCKGTPEWERDA